MFWIIFIIIVVLIFFVLGYKLATRRRDESLDKINKDKQRQKEIIKEKILELLDRQGQITNNDVEKNFNISDSTAQRYLQELVIENEIIQKGEKRGIFYIKQ